MPYGSAVLLWGMEERAGVEGVRPWKTGSSFSDRRVRCAIHLNKLELLPVDQNSWWELLSLSWRAKVLFWNCPSGGQAEAGPRWQARGRSWRRQPEPATPSQHAAREQREGSVTLLISDRWKRAAHFHISRWESTNSGQIRKDVKGWAFFQREAPNSQHVYSSIWNIKLHKFCGNNS